MMLEMKLFITQVLKSNPSNYNNAYILISSDISIIGDNRHQVAFKNCTQFTKCFTQFDRTAIGNAK